MSTICLYGHWRKPAFPTAASIRFFWRPPMRTAFEKGDAWVAASSLIPVTSKMKFLVAVRPGIMSPSQAARMAATFDRLSEGRLLINVVTGGDPVELAGDGIHLSHRERYKLTDEFLTIWRNLLENREADFTGKYLNVKGSKLLYPTVQQPYPPLYFGGSSEIGQEVAAKHVDVYLTWGEPGIQNLIFTCQ